MLRMVASLWRIIPVLSAGGSLILCLCQRPVLIGHHHEVPQQLAVFASALSSTA